MSDLSGGAKCVKYTLFIFNLLFLLAGLALIIVGAIVQVQTSKSSFGDSVSGAGIFIIIIGSVVFLICFFGCAGAINNNYCMVVTYGILLLLVLLAQIAAVIAGFVLKDQVKDKITKQMNKDLDDYDPAKGDNVANLAWDSTQEAFKCCGTSGYMSWENNTILNDLRDVPLSCCSNVTQLNCNKGKLDDPNPTTIFTKGCIDAVDENVKRYMVAVGAVAAAVALLELLGVIFAFCLAGALRKDYRVV